MAPERIDQFSHRRYVSLSLLSFHLSCVMAARFPCIMAVQLMGAVPVTTGSTVTVIYYRRASIMDRIVILISRFYEMFSWGESRPLYFGLVPPSAPLIPPIVVLTDISCFQSIHSESFFLQKLTFGSAHAERVRQFRPFTPVEPR